MAFIEYLLFTYDKTVQDLLDPSHEDDPALVAMLESAIAEYQKVLAEADQRATGTRVFLSEIGRCGHTCNGFKLSAVTIRFVLAYLAKFENTPPSFKVGGKMWSEPNLL